VQSDYSGVSGGRMRCTGIQYIFPVLFERPVSVARSATRVPCLHYSTAFSHFHSFLLEDCTSENATKFDMGT